MGGERSWRPAAPPQRPRAALHNRRRCCAGAVAASALALPPSQFRSPPSPTPAVHISGVVAVIAAVPGIAAYGLRHVLPLPASVVLWHIAGTGMLVAAAATEALAGRTTWIMGKAGTGSEGAGRGRVGPRMGAGTRGGTCAAAACPRLADALPPFAFSLSCSAPTALSTPCTSRCCGPTTWACAQSWRCSGASARSPPSLRCWQREGAVAGCRHRLLPVCALCLPARSIRHVTTRCRCHPVRVVPAVPPPVHIEAPGAIADSWMLFFMFLFCLPAGHRRVLHWRLAQRDGARPHGE